MRILFTLITILFFSFNNVKTDTFSKEFGEEYDKNRKGAMIKGEILYAYNVADKDGFSNKERFIVRYNGKIFKCYFRDKEYFCLGMYYK